MVTGKKDKRSVVAATGGDSDGTTITLTVQPEK
jgi:hypothetical protein